MSWQLKSAQIEKEIEATSPAYQGSWWERNGLRFIGILVAIPFLMAGLVWLQTKPFAKTIAARNLGSFVCEGKHGRVGFSRGFTELYATEDDVLRAIPTKLVPGPASRKAMFLLGNRVSVIRSPKKVIIHAPPETTYRVYFSSDHLSGSVPSAEDWDGVLVESSEERIEIPLEIVEAAESEAGVSGSFEAQVPALVRKLNISEPWLGMLFVAPVEQDGSMGEVETIYWENLAHHRMSKQQQASNDTAAKETLEEWREKQAAREEAKAKAEDW